MVYRGYQDPQIGFTYIFENATGLKQAKDNIHWLLKFYAGNQYCHPFHQTSD